MTAPRRKWQQSEEDPDIAISPTNHEYHWWTRPLARLNSLEETTEVLAAALASVQWVAVTRDGEEVRACPACSGRQPTHLPGCALARALTRVAPDGGEPLG